MATSRSSNRLTLKDRLSQLSYSTAKKLLGSNADRWLVRGTALDVDIDNQVRLTAGRFQLKTEGEIVLIRLSDDQKYRLLMSCTCGSAPCEHRGLAVSLLLEQKLILGLSTERPLKKPLGTLTDEEAREHALADRMTRAKEENMQVRSTSPEQPWTDYTVTNRTSGRAYRVALRGLEPGDAYCTCPDFRKNTLGTCKHILKTIVHVKRKFPKAAKTPYRRKSFSVRLSLGETVDLRLETPWRMSEPIAAICEPCRDKAVKDIASLLITIEKLERAGQKVQVYPDAEEFIHSKLELHRLSGLCDSIRQNPSTHPLRTSLLRVALLSHQMSGIAFCAGAGRAILADDMGLGKTIQGIGVAELLAQQCGIERTLIICPASLKAQWQSEIRKFSTRCVEIVAGPSAQRTLSYRTSAFFTICNYEQALKDIQYIERASWDFIIIDEAQRIKNWEAKTTRMVKGLRSRYALALTGTPLENRVDDLFSIAEFIDENHLGPAFAFFNRHRLIGDDGRLAGYRNLAQLREYLQPILLRRTRGEILKSLPERTTSILRIDPTAEQKALHDGNLRSVSAIIKKKHLTEMDLLRLRKHLLMCRLAADGTALVDKQVPGFSTKLERLNDLLIGLMAQPDRKVVLFSEWTSMLDLIEPLLEKLSVSFVRLDGSVPQGKRPPIVHRFQNDPDCRLFMTTNAGSTGLNLQAANTVINVDLPWNPAVLEQRIARAHRMGQTSPVQVFVLVTNETIEENLLGTLSAKHSLALACLDTESEADVVTLQTGIDELKGRLEKLLGAQADAPEERIQQEQAQVSSSTEELRSAVATAGGEMMQAAIRFFEKFAPAGGETQESARQAAAFHEKLLECVEKKEDGTLSLNIALPGEDALRNLSKILCGMVK